MLRSLVGSEMCIRDRWSTSYSWSPSEISSSSTCSWRSFCGSSTTATRDEYGCRAVDAQVHLLPDQLVWRGGHRSSCLLYTSDAADEEDSVDLGGRRIIK
eukprot:TRINITY_DN28214_c0_g1_i1.p1 TRINITY_DN28214_c0_g1~~TRINITY_DN28214_c0_g1_i1.p1  ORF type:complete len:100 (+),score=14.28 TRINITY_DN28214_c0_g1_i1:98-397(+)